MQKYVLAGSDGIIQDNFQLSAGKYVHSTTEFVIDPIHKIIDSGEEHPLVIALLSPHPISKDKRIFMLQSWNVNICTTGPKAYTIVKEMEVPIVNTKQRLAFCISALQEIVDTSEFKEWADAWLAQEDRSKISIDFIREYIENELFLYENLQPLEKNHFAIKNQTSALECIELLYCINRVLSAAEESIYRYPDWKMINDELNAVVTVIKKNKTNLNLVRLALDSGEGSNVISIPVVKHASVR